MINASNSSMPVRQRDATGLPGIVDIANGAVAGGHPLKTWNNDDGPSFSDFLDTINPLQHIPIINTLYRHLTGDTEGAGADLAGGALYGGPIGVALAAIGLAFERQTGEGPGDTVYAALFGDDKPAGDDTAVARNDKTNDKTNGDAPAASAAAQPGAVKTGDYLVFGGSATTGRPQAITPSTTAVPAAAAAVSAAAPVDGAAFAARQGDYLVLGGSTPSAAIAARTPPPASADITAVAAASGNGAPLQTTLNRAANRNGPLNPLPARRDITPPANLPMPTTGPGALPGGHSQATARGVGNDWFADTFNKNMDKYDSLHATGAYDAAAQAASGDGTLN